MGNNEVLHQKQQWSHIVIDFKLQCPLGLVVICQLLHKKMSLLLRLNGWLFECVAIEHLEPSGDSFIPEYCAHALTFLYLNVAKRVSFFFFYSIVQNIVWLNVAYFISCHPFGSRIEKSENFRIWVKKISGSQKKSWGPIVFSEAEFTLLLYYRFFPLVTWYY